MDPEDLRSGRKRTDFVCTPCACRHLVPSFAALTGCMQLWRDQETAIQCSRCFLECLVTSPQVPQQSQLTEVIVSITLRVTIQTSSKYCQVVWLPSYTHRTRSASRVLGDRSRVIFHPEKVGLFASKRQLGTFSMGLAEENPCTSWECG